MRLGKLTLGRKGYWIGTVALLAVQWFAPASLSSALLVPWLILYTARLRDAGRSMFHLLHLAGAVALILIPVFFAPTAFAAYVTQSGSGEATSMRDTLVFLVGVVGGLAYYVAFSIWLGCIKTKAAKDPAGVAETFT